MEDLLKITEKNKMLMQNVNALLESIISNYEEDKSIKLFCIFYANGVQLVDGIFITYERNMIYSSYVLQRSLIENTIKSIYLQTQTQNKINSVAGNDLWNTMIFKDAVDMRESGVSKQDKFDELNDLFAVRYKITEKETSALGFNNMLECIQNSSNQSSLIDIKREYKFACSFTHNGAVSSRFMERTAIKYINGEKTDRNLLIKALDYLFILEKKLIDYLELYDKRITPIKAELLLLYTSFEKDF